MKFYNPWAVALKNNDNVLGVFFPMSILFGIIFSVYLVLTLFGVYGLLIFPVITIGRVLYAVFTGK